MCSVCTNDNFYVLKYDADKVIMALDEIMDETNKMLNENDEEGIEDAFELLNEFDIKICSGVWSGDCFLFVNSCIFLIY